MKRLIVNADDFGRSHSINQAVVQAHRHGILTTASLMVNEPGADDAIAAARNHPSLGVGLHLVVAVGKSALDQQKIPRLVDAQKNFSNNPVGAGLKYFFSAPAKRQLEDEIGRQFEKFQASGLVLDHVNGHLNMHLHPTVLDILMRNAERWGVKHFRLTCDPLCLNFQLARGRWAYRISHWLIYRLLAAHARPILRRQGIAHTQSVFGLLQSGRVDENFLGGLLGRLPEGDYELYSHPSLDEFKHELDALISPRMASLIKERGIKLIRYQDL